MTDDEVMADVSGDADRTWNDKALIAGRSCRDAVARSCQWHKGRGMEDAPC